MQSKGELSPDKYKGVTGNGRNVYKDGRMGFASPYAMMDTSLSNTAESSLSVLFINLIEANKEVNKLKVLFR